MGNLSELTGEQLSLLADVAIHGVRDADASHRSDLADLERQGVLYRDPGGSFRLTHAGRLLAHFWSGLPVDSADRH